MIAKDLPSLDRLDKLFSYNPETGQLMRKVGGVFKVTANPHKKTKYIWVTVDRVTYAAHRICWKLYHRKDIPHSLEIDHINGNPSDNRIQNLRLVTMSENMRNKKRYGSNTSGIVGVALRSDMREGTARWRAQINIDGKSIKIGSFKTQEEAITARREAEMRFGFSDGHGRR